jgi:hypothetical protein
MRGMWLAIVGVCFAAGIALSFFDLSRRTQRRSYWAAAALAAVSGFLAVYPDYSRGLWLAALGLGAMIVMAYVATPYIKIGGKIYALTVRDQQPDPDDTRAAGKQPSGADTLGAEPHADPAPDSYGGLLTATTLWWMLAGLALIAGGNTYAYLFSNGEAAAAAISAALAALVAVGIGYGDASWGYPIARRQYLAFGVATLLTSGVFALVYLVAYYTARRLPLRRTQSLEYRAHPRHQRNEP